MKQKNLKNWVAAASVLAVAVSLSSRAKGELVYENDVQPSASAGADRVEERESLRQAIIASEKAKATLSESAPTAVTTSAISAPVLNAPVVSTPIAAVPMGTMPAQTIAPVQQVQIQNSQVEVGPARVLDTVEVQNVSKSEMVRRERIRQEAQSEDILHERLEAMRLEDERRRTQAFLSTTGLATGGAYAANGGIAQTANVQQNVGAGGVAVTGIQEQAIVAPVTERPAQAASGSVVVASAAGSSPVVVTSGGAEGVSVSHSVENEEKIAISVQPRGGIADMNNKSYYDVKPRYGAGVGVMVASSDNLSFELGYTYAEYGVQIASSNPWVQTYQTWALQNGRSASYETVAMKQNVFDLGLKVHVLGSSARLRPFIGGGGAYSKSFINYDQGILSILNQDPTLRTMASDYELSQYLGYLSGGLDVRIAKNISVGAVFKYYAVLSARESSGINNAALYGAYGTYGTTTYANQDAEKAVVGNSLSKAGFYSALAGVTLTF